jgi:phosphatidate cytidylyltransferase
VPALPDLDSTVPSASPAPKPRWGDFALRALSALVLAPLSLAALWAGGQAWAVMLGLGMLVLGAEWARLCRLDPLRPPGLLLPLLLLAAGAAAVVHAEKAAISAIVLGMWLLMRIGGLMRQPHARWLALGLPYIGLPAIALWWLRADTVSGFGNVLYVILVVWAADIGAYFTGRLIGGPRLAPSISPGKTWSGAAGGLVAGLLVGLAVAETIAPGAPLRPAAVALALAVAAEAGDLLESWIKRRAGVKDSGQLIPGHGGLLDRLDGLMAASLVAAIAALLLGPGEMLWK